MPICRFSCFFLLQCICTKSGLKILISIKTTSETYHYSASNAQTAWRFFVSAFFVCRLVYVVHIFNFCLIVLTLLFSNIRRDDFSIILANIYLCKKGSLIFLNCHYQDLSRLGKKHQIFVLFNDPLNWLRFVL